MTPMGRIKNFTADNAIGKRRIVKFGSAEGFAALAVSGAALMGVSGVRGAEAGQRIDVHLDDVQPIELGGPVAYGDYLTADAQGRAIKANPAAGEKIEVVGRAMANGNLGAIVDALVAPQQITG